MRDPTRRFSNRVDNYVKYRPSYPAEVLEILARACGLRPEHSIADIGSGTGKLTELLLSHGNRVYAVEPNDAMRAAAEQLLGGNERFISVNGQAEATGLPDQSVELVTAGQAFHWFKLAEARMEFARILRPGGWVALIWNIRRTSATPFMQEYEQLLRVHGTDYSEVSHERSDDQQNAYFFGPGGFALSEARYDQHFDFEGLKGRVLSSSYMPTVEDPRYPAVLQALEALFERHAQAGLVTFSYDTKIIYGQLRPGGSHDHPTAH